MNADLEGHTKGVNAAYKSPRDHAGRRSKGVKADRPRSTQTHVHDPGGSTPYHPSNQDSNHGDEKLPEHLPTTDDLAKSFLQAEPKEKKAELEAAIAHSQYLDQSQTASEYSDESSNLGVGSAISLPGFLAEFLKGVGDRVQVRIQDVALDLNLKVDLPSQSGARSDVSDGTEPVTIRLSVEDIALNGVTNLTATKEGDKALEISGVDVHEMRRVTINNLQIMLISEASVFANLARSTGQASPETTHVSTMGRSASKPSRSSISNTETMSSASAHSTNSPPQTQKDLGIPATNEHSQSFEDAVSDEDDEALAASPYRYALGDSRYRESSVTSSFYSGRGRSQGTQDNIAHSTFLRETSLHSATANDRMSSSSVHAVQESLYDDQSPPESFGVLFNEPSSHGLHELDHSLSTDDLSNAYNSAAPNESPESSQQLFASARSASNPSSPASDRISPSEDLTQSKIFSHEEAESMYMSAVSHDLDSKDNSLSLPGKWEQSDSESEGEGPIASFLEEPSLLQNRRRGPPQESGLGLDSRYDRPASQQPGPTDSPTELVATHPSKQTSDNRTVPDAVVPSVEQSNTSSRGSESSSANLKSSFIMEKRIVNVDTIVLDLPRESSHTSIDSIEPTISRQSTSGPSPPTSSSRLPQIAIIEPSASASKTANTNEFEHSGHPSVVAIGKVQVLGDMALTRIVVLIIQQMNASRQNSHSQSKRSEVPKPSSTEKRHVRLMIKEVCWKFLDVVKGVPITSSRSKQRTTPSHTFSSDSDVLLRAEIESLHAVHRDPKSSSTFKLSAGKFRFGYAEDDILSFDSGLKMRESTRDILAPIDNDMAVTVKQISGTTEIHLTTLPLHVDLDLRRLDETFGWFGGLSSMLDLGSSMMSTVTVKDAVPKASHPHKPSRGVHFETPKPKKTVQPRSDEPQDKATVRIGGLVFDLRGSQASLRLESTAMKVVNRSEGLGLVVDRLNLSGPYLQRMHSEPSIGIKLASLRIEYLSEPKEGDLDRLLALLSPSRDKYERDDDILVDTLLSQRRKGGVLRATVKNLESQVSNMEDLQCFPSFAEDLRKLSNVAKYLPEDDRPGVMTLALIHDVKLEATVGGQFGVASLSLKDLESAYITLPSLMALGIKAVRLQRNHVEDLVGDAVSEEMSEEKQLPMVMARFIGNEMVPTAKIKLHNIRLEYHVPTIVAIMGYSETTDGAHIVADVVSSVATLTGRDPVRSSPPKFSTQASTRSDAPTSLRALRFDIALRDCIIGLNPRSSHAKGLVVLTDTHLIGVMPPDDEASATLELRKTSIMVIDNAANVTSSSTSSKRRSLDGRKRSQIENLSATGYVSVSTISAAKATIQIVKAEGDPGKSIDIDIRDELFVLESCADSTQTLVGIINRLSPPTPPSKELKYRTEVVPVEDMLASFTGDAYTTAQGDYGSDSELPLGFDDGDMVDDEVPQNLEFVSSFYDPDPEAASERIADSMLEDNLESLASPSVIREIGDKNLLGSFEEQAQVAPGNMPLEFQDDHFGSKSTIGGTAHRWDTQHNTYELSNDTKLRSSPLRVRVRDVHIIWNLFDGYDWQHTRDVISHAVEEVQNKAAERLSRKDKRKSLDPEEDEESVIGDFLFNSIYIGIPANRDPNELTGQVNHHLDELASETGSYNTSTTSNSPSRQGHPQRPKTPRLRLRRSKHHKMAFELQGISADVVVFPPDSGETQSSIDIRVQDLEIFDHVPTSTWKKFATYMHDAGERESGTSMLHLEILNVKPVPNLAASEMILKVRCPTSWNALADCTPGNHSPFEVTRRSRCS